MLLPTMLRLMLAGLAARPIAKIEMPGREYDNIPIARVDENDILIVSDDVDGYGERVRQTFSPVELDKVYYDHCGTLVVELKDGRTIQISYER